VRGRRLRFIVGAWGIVPKVAVFVAQSGRRS
jgi:hypothetical protein